MIQTEDQLAEYQAAKDKVVQAEKEKNSARDKKLQALKTKWDKFCHGLNKEDFEQSFVIKKELLDEGAKAEDLDLKINTVELYSKGFTFPDIGHFDYSSEQLNDLEAA